MCARKATPVTQRSTMAGWRTPSSTLCAVGRVGQPYQPGQLISSRISGLCIDFPKFFFQRRNPMNARFAKFAGFAKTQVNGIDLYYQSHGDGPPLFLLHGGWPTSTIGTISIDSRGHGRSTFTAAPISYALMASDV